MSLLLAIFLLADKSMYLSEIRQDLTIARSVAWDSTRNPTCRFYFEGVLAHPLEQLLNSDIEMVVTEVISSRDGQPAWAGVICGLPYMFLDNRLFDMDYDFMAAVIVHELAHMADCKEDVFRVQRVREAGELAEIACFGNIRRPSLFMP